MKIILIFITLIIVSSAYIFKNGEPGEKKDYSENWSLYCAGAQRTKSEISEFCENVEECVLVVGSQKRPCSNKNTFSQTYKWFAETSSNNGHDCRLASTFYGDTTEFSQPVQGKCNPSNISRLVTENSGFWGHGKSATRYEFIAKLSNLFFKDLGDTAFIGMRPVVIYSKDESLLKFHESNPNGGLFPNVYSEKEWQELGEQTELFFPPIRMRPIGSKYFEDGCTTYQGTWVKKDDYAYCDNYKLPPIEIDTSKILADPEKECARVGGKYTHGVFFTSWQCVTGYIVRNGVKTAPPEDSDWMKKRRSMEYIMTKKCICKPEQCNHIVDGKMTCIDRPDWANYF